MEENKHKKSKALIITIICIIILLLIGFLLYKNRDIFGVKTSATIAKIFSPLITSDNTKDLNKIDQNSKKTLVQALENVKKGDNVSVFGTGANNIPLARQSGTSDSVYGFANQDIASGDIGEVIIGGNELNTFWNSFSNFLGNIFNKGQTKPAEPSGGWAMDTNGHWIFNPNGNGGWIYNSTSNSWTPPGGISLPPAGGWIFNYNTGVWDFDQNGTGGWVYNGEWISPGGTNNSSFVWTFNPGVGNWTFNPSTGTWVYDTVAGNWIIPSGVPVQPAGGWTYDSETQSWVFDENGTGIWVFNPNTGSWVSPGTIVPPPSGGWVYNYGTQSWVFDPSGGEWIYNPNTGGWISPGGNNGTSGLGSCTNGATNPPLCTTNNGVCMNGATNPPLCTTSTDNTCINGATNPPLCTTTSSGTCINGATNPPICTTNPGNICVNGANNPPACTTNNGVCVNGATNPPNCTVLPGGLCFNGANNPPACTNVDGSCINGATNPPECTVVGGICVNGASNPPLCTLTNDDNNGLPDLVAGNVTPINTTINTPTTLSSTITNVGTGGTGSSFSSFFTITNVSSGVTIEKTATVPSLGAGVGNVAIVLNTFSAIGEYSIRACADKSSVANTGTIAESNEDNNCGAWTTFNVTNTLPIDGDVCTNGADNPTLCTTTGGLCVNGATNPPECTNLVCPNGATDYPTCTTFPVTETNACLDIEKNPLTFTDAEKAKLAELLRKFYLIAPTLKTVDDISLVYSDVTQQSNFSDQLTGLINECYNESVDRNGNVNPNYTGPTARFGNPWFNYDYRGSYVDIGSNNDQPTAACYGTLIQGGSSNGSPCSIMHDPFNCEWAANPTPPPLRTGCYWMDEKEYEEILNVW